MRISLVLKNLALFGQSLVFMRQAVEIPQPDSSANQKFSVSDACKKSYFFPLEVLFVATQYEIPFKLSMSTFQVSIIAMTPAIASHKVRHPSC
jgi:hypothetical protein